MLPDSGAGAGVRLAVLWLGNLRAEADGRLETIQTEAGLQLPGLWLASSGTGTGMGVADWRLKNPSWRTGWR